MIKSNNYLPSDYFSEKYPVSIKGIIILNKQIVLLKNEREEWELPGGKLEANETLESCLMREIKEELSIEVTVKHIVDAWLYKIGGKVNVLIVSYYCDISETHARHIKLSPEHKEANQFNFHQIKGLNMPRGYKNSIFAVKKYFI